MASRGLCVREQHCSTQPSKQSGPKLALPGPKSSQYSAEFQAFPNWSRTNGIKQYQQCPELAETQTCLVLGLSQDAAQAPCLLSLVGGWDESLTGKVLATCTSFLRVPVMKHPDQKQLRDYLAYNSRFQSITRDTSHNTSTGKEPVDTCCLLTTRSAPLCSYTEQGP